MLNYNEFKTYDLPLQLKLNSNHSNQINNKIYSKDMPKQIPRDVYRISDKTNKENISNLPKIRENKPQILVLKQSIKSKLTSSNNESSKKKIIPKENRSDYLRTIIQRQLSSKRNQQLEMKKINVIAQADKQNGFIQQNKYKQLLSKFYGDPKQCNRNDHQKFKQLRASQDIQSPRLQRFKSQRKLNDRYQDEGSVKSLRYRCNSAMKLEKQTLYLQPSSTKNKQSSIKPQPSYLELYWKKRSPLLIL